MNSIILTGVSRGLGYALHDLLTNDSLFSQHIFISRNPPVDAYKNVQYMQIDLGAPGLKHFPLEIAVGTRVVVLISNAGTIEPIGKAVEISPADMENALRVNCLGPLALAQQLVTLTKEVGARLFILNISSGAARHPIKGWMAYCVGKAAAAMALDVLVTENEHVEVLHFDPGVMDTDMQKCIRQQTIDAMPDVDIFKGYKVDSALKKPSEVAEQIISILRDKAR